MVGISLRAIANRRAYSVYEVEGVAGDIVCDYASASSSAVFVGPTLVVGRRVMKTACTKAWRTRPPRAAPRDLEQRTVGADPILR